MKTFRGLLATAIALLVVGVSGCEGTSPVGATGEVLLDGQPLPTGTIVFEPLPGSDGQRRDANIIDGRFALPDDQGLLPGQEFHVVIKAFRKTGRKYLNADMGSSAEEMEQYLPEKYNSSSDLHVTISPDASQNHHVFDLVSRPE